MTNQFPKALLIYGCGNMGGAMLSGWITAGIDPAQFTVVDPFAKELPIGVRHCANTADLDAHFDVVVLCIKPQMLPELAGDIASCVSSGATVISLLAGIESQSLTACFPGRKIIRLMPNLAAAIGKSPLGLWSSDLSDDEKATVTAWLAPLGAPVWLSAEGQMNAVTALAGSGPAFVYRFLDALGAGGAALGLDPAVSAQLALNMVEGAALLAANATDSPAELAKKVTSPGGTTAAGLAELDADAALTQLIEATLRAARDRGIELGSAPKLTV
jgi:pyrroline-5-carboxylate reductase